MIRTVLSRDSISSESEDRSDAMSNDNDKKDKHVRGGLRQYLTCMNSTRLMVLAVLCLQNSMFTVLRRYSQGVLREVYSKVRKKVCLD
jgi:hypothetical protein